MNPSPRSENRMLTLNNDSRIGEAILAHMRENPRDSTHRKIYADWLGENGREDEALHHRIIAHLMDTGSEAAHRFSEEEDRPRARFGVPTLYFHNQRILQPKEPTSSLYVYGRKKMNPKGRRGEATSYHIPRRLATPQEASEAVVRIGHRVGYAHLFHTFFDPLRLNEGRLLELQARDNAARMPVGLGSSRRQHEDAAEARLSAAGLLESGGSRRATNLATRLRRSALANLYASFLHGRHSGQLEN